MAHAHADDLIEEVTNFLVSSPTAEEIIAFRISEPVDNRLHELLDRNRAGTLTADERAELDPYLWMNRFLAQLKLKARLKLKDRPAPGFPVDDLGPWPDDLSLRRETMYGDEGR